MPGADHHHTTGRPTPIKALWVALALNATFMVVELIGGWLTNSLAVLSDAGHMVSDVASLIIALLAAKLATREGSASYTFGLRRAPVLGGMLNAALLTGTVIFIVIEAIERFAHPPLVEGMSVFFIGLIGLAVNLGSAWYLSRTGDHSVNTRGAMLHLLADALGSVAVIVAALAIQFFDAPIADPIASLLIAVAILLGSIPLLRETMRILLQRAPAHIDVDAVRASVASHDGIVSVEDLHLWGLDSGQAVITAVVLVSTQDLTEADGIADGLRQRLREEFGIKHATLECRRTTSVFGLDDF